MMGKHLQSKSPKVFEISSDNTLRLPKTTKSYGLFGYGLKNYMGDSSSMLKIYGDDVAEGGGLFPKLWEGIARTGGSSYSPYPL